MVQTLQIFVDVPQSQFLPGCGRRRDFAATCCLPTVKVPQIQFLAGVSGHFSRHRDRYAELQLCMVGTVAAMRGDFAAVLHHFIIDFPVPGRGGGARGGLQGLPQGQGSTASAVSRPSFLLVEVFKVSPRTGFRSVCR